MTKQIISVVMAAVLLVGCASQDTRNALEAARIECDAGNHYYCDEIPNLDARGNAEASAIAGKVASLLLLVPMVVLIAAAGTGAGAGGGPYPPPPPPPRHWR